MRQRFSDMGEERDVVIGYLFRVGRGLVASAVIAVTADAEVAAGAILASVMVLSLAASYVILRAAK